MGITVNNTLAKGLQAYMTWAGRQAEDAARESGELIKAASQKVVPVDTGRLKASCRLKVTGEGMSRKASISYHTDYALRIHENLNIKHPIHATHNCGGGAKFLERPLYEMSSTVLATVARKLAR